MKQKYYWVFGIIVLVLVISIFLVLNADSKSPIGKRIKPQQETPTNQNTFSPADTLEIRKTTFAHCQNLLDKTINYKGRIIFEECGKNCLGGCPNSGPSYCFYGIQDPNQCVVYLQSKIDSRGDERFKDTEKIFNRFNVGQTVEIKGKISLYHSNYCDSGEGGGNEVPECSYFVMEEI